MDRDYIVFILSFGRPDRVYTYNTLRKCGYTGRIVIVVDDSDPCVDEYSKNFEDVVVFNKEEIGKTFDLGDNQDNTNVIVFARNVCFEIAEEMGVEWFIELDDDYTEFAYKFDRDLRYGDKNIKNLDAVFGLFFNFMKKNKKIDCISTAQNGDFIGGKQSGFARTLRPKRKIMNSFFCSTKRKFTFLGRVNEDVNTYASAGCTNKLFLMNHFVSLNQKTTQKNEGGMTDLYLAKGTYYKSFFSVMYAPSCVKISMMGSKNKRIHHKVSWKYAVPKILSEKHRG